MSLDSKIDEIPVDTSVLEVKKRLLWVILGDNESYGFRRAFLGLIDSLAERSVEIGFVSVYSGAFSKEIEEAGYPIWFLGCSRGSEETKKKGWRFLVGGVRLAYAAIGRRAAISRIIKTFRPDWVHISNNSLLVTGGLAAKLSGVPSFWHIHNTILSKLPFGLQPIIYQIICRALSVRPVANSRHTAESLGTAICSADICYPGTNVSHFSVSSDFDEISKIDIGADPSLPIFSIVARLDEKKAQDRVVEAALALFDEGQCFTLLLVGGPLDSDFAKSIVSRVEEEGRGSLIKFMGAVSDPRPYFHLSDVVVNSRVDAEPFGLSIVESMLMNTPVLAYKLGGPTETVVDGLTGWTIDEATVEGYRGGLARALEYRSYWPKMGKSARRIAVARFSAEETTDAYLKIVGKRVDFSEPAAELAEGKAGLSF